MRTGHPRTMGALFGDRRMDAFCDLHVDALRVDGAQVDVRQRATAYEGQGWTL